MAGLRTERWVRTAFALAIFLGIYGSWRVTHWGPSSAQSWIGDVFFLPAGGAAIWAVWRAAQRTEAAPRRARAWGLLGLAVLSYLLGEIAYLAFDLAGISPYPSPADGFYLGFYPLFFAGLLSFLPQMRNRREHVRFWLDMSVVALGGTAALLYLVLGPAHAAHGKSPVATAFSIAYPVGDMILLVGLAAVIVRGSESPMRRPLYLLADCGQGFLLGRPCSAEQTTDLLLRCTAQRPSGDVLPAGACIRGEAPLEDRLSRPRRPLILAPQISD